VRGQVGSSTTRSEARERIISCIVDVELVTVLEETDGGSFLSVQMRDRVQELVKQSTAGVTTELRLYQQR
jgi:hypothetical protein